jgi:hypothetical protein
MRSACGFQWLLIVALAGAPLARSASGEETAPAPIDRNGVLILIRSTLLALDQANKTGNYTVMRDLGSPAFQSNSAARLAEIFAKLRNDNLDLSGVAALDPQLSLLPQVDANGMMRMAGFFPSAPSQINFELVYAPVNHQWRLQTISVGLGQSAPVAPTAPPAAAPPKSKAPHAQAIPKVPKAIEAPEPSPTITPTH